MEERQRWRFDARSSFLTLGVVALMGTGVHLYQAQSAPPAREERVIDLDRIAKFKVGTQGVLRDPMRGGVFAGFTREDYSAYAKAQAAHDQAEQRSLVVTNKAFRILNGNVADIRGKDPSGLVKIRILGGDHAGEVAWTSGEFFNPDAMGDSFSGDDGAGIMGGP